MAARNVVLVTTYVCSYSTFAIHVNTNHLLGRTQGVSFLQMYINEQARHAQIEKLIRSIEKIHDVCSTVIIPTLICCYWIVFKLNSHTYVGWGKALGDCLQHAL